MTRAVQIRPFTKWGILWASENRIDGRECYFMWVNCQPLLFNTRKAARKYVTSVWGYMRNRPDLRCEPFGWRMPRPVRVEVILRPARRNHK